jgi:hypothetical protein
MVAGETQIRPYTPALVAGLAAGQRDRQRVELTPGVSGEVLTFGNETTVVLTRVGSSVAFIPALVCRDRATAGSGRPAELPAERWQPVELESVAFNQRYVLMSLVGQEEGLVRELFSPSLISWLESEPPAGFSVELNEGFMTIALPGYLEGDERDRLLSLAGQVAARLDAEIAEEGEESLDVFSEKDEVKDIERGLEDVGFEEAPESVAAAVEIAVRRAAWKPMTLIKALGWGIAVAAVISLIAALVSPSVRVLAVASVALVVTPVAAWVTWLVVRRGYRWGTASVSRVGLEAWTRGYAESRGLEIEDRWRFHATHRTLPVPGLADHVLAGELPRTQGLNGRLLLMADAAELRALGQEIVYMSERPLCSSAILIEAGAPFPENASDGLELPDEYHVEIDGSQILVWRSVLGNLARTSAGTDRFCERASGVVRQIVKEPAAGAVVPGSRKG